MTKKPYEWRGDFKPQFDEGDFARLLGKRLLVGVTYLSPLGDVEEQEQFYGIVTKADSSGVFIALEGERVRETWTMPPDLTAVTVAKPGEYHLRSTGEVVIDPDFTAMWTVNKPAKC